MDDCEDVCISFDLNGKKIVATAKIKTFYFNIDNIYSLIVIPEQTA